MTELICVNDVSDICLLCFLLRGDLTGEKLQFHGLDRHIPHFNIALHPIGIV